MRGQLERDRQLVGLMRAMEDFCSFVDVVRALPNKIQLLEDVLDQTLKQTVECAIFIREYTGHGFGGEHRGHMHAMAKDELVRSTCKADAS